LLLHGPEGYKIRANHQRIWGKAGFALRIKPLSRNCEIAAGPGAARFSDDFD